VHWIEHDLLSWSPQRRYYAWHDRADFHFLVYPAQRWQADRLAAGGRPVAVREALKLLGSIL